MITLTQEEAREITQMLEALDITVSLSEALHEIEVKSLKHVISEHESEIEGLIERLEEKENENKILWERVHQLETLIKNI